jgi:hypothetical protein
MPVIGGKDVFQTNLIIDDTDSTLGSLFMR